MTGPTQHRRFAQRRFAQRRLAFSLFLGLCLTVLAANTAGLFRGADITPMLTEVLNLPGMLFASLLGSPLGHERAGMWRVMFYLGDLIAYTFIAYIALTVGNSRIPRPSASVKSPPPANKI